MDLLHERNEQIRHALAKVIAADGPVKATLFGELVTILAAREAVVQELKGPLVERQGLVTSAVDTGPAEQTAVISGLSLVSGLDVEGDDFDGALIKIARIVTLHIAAKERHDFPLLRRSLPAEELHALAEVLISAETITSARAHCSPDSDPVP
ncbi:MAG TPA: hypothetical protein VES03_00830 [Motilibacterales bacterium]|nr:hypothetical protein [Motilibacterales bacterium]